MFICGSEPGREEMATDLCFYCLHWGGLEKTVEFIFTTVQMPFIYAVHAGIFVQFAGLWAVWACCYFLHFIAAAYEKVKLQSACMTTGFVSSVSGRTLISSMVKAEISFSVTLFYSHWPKNKLPESQHEGFKQDRNFLYALTWIRKGTLGDKDSRRRCFGN